MSAFSMYPELFSTTAYLIRTSNVTFTPVFAEEKKRPLQACPLERVWDNQFTYPVIIFVVNVLHGVFEVRGIFNYKIPIRKCSTVCWYCYLSINDFSSIEISSFEDSKWQLPFSGRIVSRNP